MISSLRLKFGRAKGTSSESILVIPVTIFVGPNGSGKSHILKEIARYSDVRNSSNNVLLDEMTLDEASIPSKDELYAQLIRSARLTITNPESPQPQVALYRKIGGTSGTQLNYLISVLERPSTNWRAFWNFYLAYRTLILDGPSRIGLVADQPSGDLQKPPETTFQTLFADDALRCQVRKIIHEAFGVYFVLDPTHMGLLRIRLSERPPDNHTEEQGWHQEARAFHAAAQPISSASDGIKAFAGIITEVIAGDPEILLIDEPEAFLHPPLAEKLGLELARAASMSPRKRVFVSTHSASFVMGCIKSGVPITIVRLTYKGRIATARVLPSDEILNLMRNPLLRSTGVMNGLFHEAMVITEADTDRAFYDRLIFGSSTQGRHAGSPIVCL